MRCFLAIGFSEKAKKELNKIQKQILEEGGRGTKLVEKENLHLTLRFFGEINDNKIKEIKKQLENFNYEKIKASLGNTGFFPSSAYVRVVWVSLEPQDKIKDLAKKINEKLKSRDERFESHITLARVKFVKDKKDFVERVKSIKANAVEFEIDSFSLKKSTLTEKGPIYETIKEFKF